MWSSKSFSQENKIHQEITAVAKTLNYVRGLDANNNKIINISVIYNPLNAFSVKESQHIKSILIDLKKIKVGEIHVTTVPVGNINKVVNSEVFFITQGMDDYFLKIREEVKKKHIFTISNDVRCASSGCCVVALNYDEAVQVYLNEAVLNYLGFDIDATFRYLANRV